MARELIRRGSSKNIYKAGKNSILFEATNYYSVFDVGRSPDTIPGKAKAIIACAVKSFQIADAIGVPTHFIEQVDDATIRVREAQIITNRSLTEKDENYVVPAEFIYRLFVAGSIYRDFRSGEKKPEHYGLPAGKIPRVGTPFPYPMHMLTTKFEHVDRDITTQEVCGMAGITLNDLAEFWSMIDRLTGATGLKMDEAGYELLDGKLECIIGPEREKMIGDVFCTPDEDRLCLIGKLKDGIVEHYSKECIRQIFIENGYKEILQTARDKGDLDPPIPHLNEEQIEEISRRYIAVAEAYSGQKIYI